MHATKKNKADMEIVVMSHHFPPGTEKAEKYSEY